MLCFSESSLVFPSINERLRPNTIRMDTFRSFLITRDLIWIRVCWRHNGLKDMQLIKLDLKIKNFEYKLEKVWKISGQTEDDEKKSFHKTLRNCLYSQKLVSLSL